MKNKWIVLAGAMALTAFTTAQAVPITGEVDMNGTVTLNSQNLGTASAANSFSAVQVGAQAGNATGSFAGTQNDSVSWNPFSWPGGSANPLWTYTDAGTGWTYSFQLQNDTVVSQSSTFLNLSGTGILNITGGSSSFDPTVGVWAFTISNAGGNNHTDFNFTFANSQTSVPDGGATVMLLGAALSALGLFRRKLIA